MTDTVQPMRCINEGLMFTALYNIHVYVLLSSQKEEEEEEEEENPQHIGAWKEVFHLHLICLPSPDSQQPTWPEACQQSL